MTSAQRIRFQRCADFSISRSAHGHLPGIAKFSMTGRVEERSGTAITFRQKLLETVDFRDEPTRKARENAGSLRIGRYGQGKLDLPPTDDQFWRVDRV
jgi:hypothetical protein